MLFVKPTGIIRRVLTIVEDGTSAVQDDQQNPAEQLSIVQDNRVKSRSPKTQPGQPTRSLSPSAEAFIPKVAVSLFVKKNGKQVGSAKRLQVDVNKDYDHFKEELYQQIFKKADANYDPWDVGPNVSIKYLWTAKKRLTSINGKKVTIRPEDCADFDDEGDYEALLQEIRQSNNAKKAGERIDAMILYVQACLVVEGENVGRTVPSDSEEVQVNSVNKRVVLSPLLQLY